MYEVDNRYPEIMPLYAETGGAKSYGALNGAALSRARRASRVNELKRGFWTAAAAVVAVLALLVTGGKEGSEAAEPFREPTLSIISAEQSPENPDELLFTYDVELNDADAVDVYVTARTEDGETLGTTGPFFHDSSGESGQMTMPVSHPVGLSKLKLELSAVYYRDGQELRLNAEREVPLREETPEPVTEPTTEPIPTETAGPPETPTLSVLSCELNGSNLSPLRYVYETGLNDAESMEITAEITDENGVVLGTDGPWTHTASERSPERETALEWETRPETVTLTLTGAYLENGETKTVTASQTLAAPEEPFTAPSLSIASAELSDPDLTPLRYRWEISLNSAESLEVTAEITDENGTVLGTDEPWTCTTQEAAEDRESDFDWETRPTEITLTLTGSYTENGETKTVTASQTLAVPEEPFTAPSLTITRAALNGTSLTPLTYSYQVSLNSASSLRVRATISSNTGAQLGTDGPYTHNASGASPARSAALRWTTRPTSVTLTLTGSYTENGETRTVTATQRLTVPEAPFTAPTLNITNASLNGTNVTPLSYGYRVTLNSAQSMQVRATVTANNGTQLGTDGPYTHNSSGASPTRSAALRWTTRPTSVTLTLTGSYTQNGQTKTVTATQRLTVPEAPFTAPTLSITNATLNGTNVTPLSYSYRVTLNSAASMQVRATVTANNGTQLGTGGPWTHSSSGASPTRSTALRWTTRPTSVTLTLTGTYTEKGTSKTVTATRTINVPEEPFTAPTLSISSASLNGTNVTPLSYSYRVTLNSAASMQVRATVRSESGNQLGTGGPWTHSASGASPTRSTNLSWTTRPTKITLTLTGTYTEKGTSKTVTATQTINVPELPFTAPTLSITNASLDSEEVTPLSYSYQVTLNSAQSMQVSAAVSSDLGEDLGEDGPYNHTASAASPTRTIDLEWDNWPGTVTLTLTGTYTQNGTTKTVTATRTLEVPEQPFTDPTLEIVNARLLLPDYSFSYNYQLELNDAELLDVSAEFSYEEENDMGQPVQVVMAEDGPISHNDSGITKMRDVPQEDFIETDGPITLTLTGTYKTRSGETRTLTATKEVEYWSLPEIDVSEAGRPAPDPNEIHYYGFAYPGSADSMEMIVEAQVEGSIAATAGPYTIDDFTELDDWIIQVADSSEHVVTLIFTGSYQFVEDEDPRTVTASIDVEPRPPFENPTIHINSAVMPADDVRIDYAYELNLNSADEINVTAYFYDSSGVLMLSTPLGERYSSGTFTESIADINLSTVTRIVLEGEYTCYGETRTVSDSAEVTVTTPPFTAPSITEFGANVPLFEESADFEVDFYYHLNMGDADQVIITVSVVSSDGLFLGDDGGITQTETDYYDGSVSPDYEDGITSVVVTITGKYQENGVTKTISQSTTVPVVMSPDSFTSDGEVSNGPENNTLYFAYWAEFLAREQDPHLNAYNFQVKSLTAYWYDNSGVQVSQTEYDSSVLSQFTISQSDNSYLFECNAIIPGAADVNTESAVIFRIVVTDVSTGNDYTTDTEMLDIQK